MAVERIIIGWVDPGDVSGRFMDSVMRVMYAGEKAFVSGALPTTVLAGHVRIESGPKISTARNTMVRRFLECEEWNDVEWLLMLDSDMTFDESILPALFSQIRTPEGKICRPVVGGLCFGGGHGSIIPTMYEIVDPKTNNDNPVRVITDWEEGQIVEVDATGAACLLIHRGVLEHLATIYPEPAPWFTESMYAGLEFGEDWTFCLRVRKEEIPIYVNTNAKVGHMKQIELNEETWRTGQIGLQSHAPPPEKIKKASGLIMPPQARLVTGPNREQRRAAARVKS